MNINIKCTITLNFINTEKNTDNYKNKNLADDTHKLVHQELLGLLR